MEDFVTQKQLLDAMQVLQDALLQKIQDGRANEMQVLLDAMQVGQDALLQKIQDERAYETGQYYRSIGLIWGHEGLEFEGAAVEWENYRSQDLSALEYYKKREGKRYYSDDFPVDRLFPVEGKSMAHLIPNDPSCSLAWLRALSIVTGIDVSNSESPLLHTALRSFVEGDAKAPLQPSAANVPLKAWAWNFLMLPESHEKHFDKIAWTSDKKVILSPIWNPDKEWNPGTGYKLMVAASPETYTWLLGTEKLDDESVQNKWFGVASPEEAGEATKFLALTVRALADLLVTHGKGDLTRPVQEHNANVKEKEGKNHGNVREGTALEEVFKSILGAIPSDLLSQRSFHTNESAITGENSEQPNYQLKAQAFVRKIAAIEHVRDKNLKSKVQIPVFNLKRSRKPILVIDLGVYFEEKKYLIPDPFLVALKAAVSWSSFQNQKLLPACGKHPDHQLGSDARKEESIPFEIFSKDTASGDDDSILSISS